MLVIIAVIVLVVGYYGISPLFKNVKLDEADPSTKTDIVVIEKPVEQSEPTLPSEEQKQTIKETKTKEPELKRAEVIGTIGHPASGFVRVVENDGKTYIRYEDFKTINGPDLFVYLSKDKNARNFINLGELKATEGNINYEVPAGIAIKDYPYALVWCRAFSVLFNSADLSSLF